MIVCVCDAIRRYVRACAGVYSPPRPFFVYFLRGHKSFGIIYVCIMYDYNYAIDVTVTRWLKIQFIYNISVDSVTQESFR